jgi:hypothetical protein
MATLVPDKADETLGFWNLAYVYEAGRTVNIQCKYSDRTSLNINLAKKIDQCRYNITKDRGLFLRCK